MGKRDLILAQGWAAERLFGSTDVLDTCIGNPCPHKLRGGRLRIRLNIPADYASLRCQRDIAAWRALARLALDFLGEETLPPFAPRQLRHGKGRL